MSHGMEPISDLETVLDMSLDEIMRRRTNETGAAPPMEQQQLPLPQGPLPNVNGGPPMGGGGGSQRPPRTMGTCDNCGQAGHVAKNCPQPKACFACGAFGHDKKDCPAVQGMQRCARCGQLGHAAPRCRSSGMRPSNMMGGGGMGMGVTGIRERDSGELFCFGCGGAGHRKYDCPSRNSVCDRCGRLGHVRSTCRQQVDGGYGGGYGGMGGGAPSGQQGGSGGGGGGGARGRMQPWNSGSFPTAACTRCAALGHGAESCPHASKRCDTCGEVGHLKAVCRVGSSR